MANIFAPLFGGFAATGAIARTATGIKSGGNCPLTSIVHALTLGFIILVLAPFATYVPLCTLASILFVVSYNMSDIPHFRLMIKQAPSYDIFLMFITFLLTVFTDLVIAINIGVILAMFFFIRNMQQSVAIEKLSLEKIKEEYPLNEIPSLPKGTSIYTIQGPFFFGVAEKIERSLLSKNKNTKTIILRLNNVSFIDMTGLETFKNLLETYHKHHVKIYLTGANSRVEKKLTRIGILPFLEKNRILKSLAEALRSVSLGENY